MRKITALVIFALVCSFAAKSQQLEYLLSYDGAAHTINVDLTLSPKSEKPLSFTYGNPDFGGQKDIGKCLKNLNVEGTRWEYVDSLRTLRLPSPKGGEPVHISYSVEGLPTVAEDFKEDLFRPHFSEENMYCHGLNLFLHLLMDH